MALAQNYSARETRAADRWWDSLPPERRMQIYSWVAQRDTRYDPTADPGQPALDELEPAS